MDNVIKEGTILVIGSRFTERVDDAVEKGIISIDDHAEFCSAAYEEWLPRKIEFGLYRIDDQHMKLGWRFLDELDEPYFNLTVFKKLGYKIEGPEETEFDIMKCPEEFLSEKELLLKNMMLIFPGQPPIWYIGIMEMMEKAMKKSNIRFCHSLEGDSNEV
jgi:hypothetical protein